MTGVVAVVGGSGGLGEAICSELAAAGRAVLVGYFSAEDKATYHSYITKAYGSLTTFNVLFHIYTDM